ncbi:hypothetical protein TSTA_097610 [Talaromyces stipitatus ATCC 10500]|uniref:Uncharacterized protein n=1 Tax=Talaromyces stipitatus (strain ATCC 10500 / CBS 375.48 / QM 6759 / NRRL 1006) TaxID=441959 RepID=B8MLZ3_TALSN|nr:uncharacterized protein TSTA_097610 [Talaromyces stipitatus ATCC 10500]EED13505.1 hypothetical protein TSTA_097610 [Talaromyces stipitatus ATCC 10500]
MTGNEGQSQQGQQGTPTTSTISHLSSTTATSSLVKTQYSGLTKFANTKLDFASIERLSRKDLYDVWIENIEGDLFSKGKALLNILNRDLARPDEDSAHFDIWHQLSATICTWMKNQVSNDLNQEIRMINGTIRYADEYAFAVKKLCKGDTNENIGWSQTAHILALHRDKFTTPEAFIIGIRNAYFNLLSTNLEMGAYLPTVLIMDGLHSELGSWVTTYEKDIPPLCDIQPEDFQHLVSKAIVAAKRYQEYHSNTTLRLPQSNASNVPQNNKGNGNRNNGSNKMRHEPAPGTDIDKHVISLRALPSKQGKCGYCSSPTHDATNCYYLMDEPPESWNPRRNNLWNYSKAKKARSGLKKSKDSTDQKPTPVPLASTSLYNSAFSTAQIPVVDTSESTTRRGPWIAPSTTTTCIESYLSHLKDDPQPYNDQGSWVADSGAANNIAGDNATFLKYREYGPGDVKPTFTCSNGTIGTAQGEGIALMRLDSGNDTYTDIALKVQHVPGLSFNLWATEPSKKDHGI